MVAVSKTWLLSKLGFKPVVMYFIRKYSTRLIPVHKGKGERVPPSSILSDGGRKLTKYKALKPTNIKFDIIIIVSQLTTLFINLDFLLKLFNQPKVYLFGPPKSE